MATFLPRSPPRPHASTDNVLTEPPKLVRHATPSAQFSTVAAEMDAAGKFDGAITTLRGLLKEAKTPDKINYFTTAFRAFLAYKGGSYSVKQSEAGEFLPPADLPDQ